ncbi:uncharacterized protein LOC132278265 [Cornus florida]|uniref:uncharacterized protein LOC132278265 n=1 Tax=Cornus florida TaxID=4283 RepID=UPI0028993305|nr:uncharacterized protein LOC132278265 [Cornus florida]
MDSDNNFQSDDEFDEMVVDALLGVAVCVSTNYHTNYIVKEPCRNSNYTGHQFEMEVLAGHHKRCHELFRMEKHVFLRLCQELKRKDLLKDSREISVEEQMAIFLMTIGHNERNRMLQEQFQHSGETISRHFNTVLKALVTFSISIIVPPSFDDIPIHMRNNPKYWSHFKGCTGAIDGTHIDAVIPVDQQLAYRGREGDCTQNVMAACSFDMKFTFVWVGWEGSAHDSRILNEALGKYYVVDAGYANMLGYLAPYKGLFV